MGNSRSNMYREQLFQIAIDRDLNDPNILQSIPVNLKPIRLKKTIYDAKSEIISARFDKNYRLISKPDTLMLIDYFTELFYDLEHRERFNA